MKRSKIDCAGFFVEGDYVRAFPTRKAAEDQSSRWGRAFWPQPGESGVAFAAKVYFWGSAVAAALIICSLLCG